MTPNFVLSLSFEGIRLLQRTGNVWNILGEVSVEATDLAEQLATLREQAEGLEPGPLRTKILLPDEQIRYTSIDGTQTSENDVYAALDGATPYPLKELVIDSDRSGGRTHIAAVAKETLAEAEAFAVEHGFNPVAFVATAEPYTFRHEVFFGTTSIADKLLSSGEVIERGDPVSLTPVPVSPLTDVKPLEPAPKTANFDLAKSSEPDTAAPDVSSSQSSDNAPEVLFARRHQAPTLSASREVPPVAKLESEPEQAAVAAPPLAAPVKTAAAKPAAKASVSKAKPSQESKKAAAAPVRKRSLPMGLILTGILLLAMFLVALWSTTLSEGGIAGWYKRTFNIVELQPPSMTPDMAIAPEQASLPTPVTELEATLPSPALPIVREPTGRVLSPAEADRIYAATGVYQRAPRLPITPREANLDDLAKAQIRPEVPRMAALVFDGDASFESDAPFTAPSNPPPAGTRYLRDLRGFILAMPDGVLTPEGAMVFAGAPEVLPRLRPGTVIPEVPAIAETIAPVDPEAFTLIGGPPPVLPRLRPEGLVVPETEAAAEVPEITLPEADVAEDVVETVTLPEALSQELNALPEVDAPTVPEIAEETTVVVPEPEEAIAAVPSELESETEAPAEATANVVEGRPEVVPPVRPASPETPAPNSGLQDAIAEALEPEDISAPAEQATPLISGDPSLLGKRPSARPGGLVSDTVIAVLSADISAPQARPAPEPAPAPETTGESISAVAAAIAAAAPESNFAAVTSSAVSASVRPERRPRNFSQVVARAQAAAARQSAPTGAVSSAPATSSGPIPGSLARAATMENAIRLRDVNLIGVYGRSNDRRALVRLASGRYVKVEVGSSLDGGRVTSINESALNYVKNGRTQTLELPSG